MNQQLTYSILTDLRSKCRQLSHRRSRIAFGLSIFVGSGLTLNQPKPETRGPIYEYEQ